jgi:superfamily II DNA or RNA helicase
MIKPLLDHAVERKIPVRIITSTYMNITDPTALLELYSYSEKVKVKLYNGRAPSFHPKAYFINGKSLSDSKVYIGSSNISRSAFTNGVEWNYAVDGSIDPESLRAYRETFDDIYEKETIALTKELIDDYRKSYVLPKDFKGRGRINKHYRKYQKKLDKKYIEETVFTGRKEVRSPNLAQIEVLNELQMTREEGNDKALIVAATGVGKTYLAAFDSKEYSSILFVAHREEILNQAYESFSEVRDDKYKFGKLYSGDKEVDSQILFASVQSLSREDSLSKYNRDSFDYIIVDEIHHGAAPTYKKIIEHFKPKFLLGLTATPHRLDKKDVFALCDFNLVYDVDLFQAINRGWLVPFKYYGIYDSTVNYDNITYLKGTYVGKELEKALSIEKRADLIYKNYLRYKRKRALGFCTSIKHADFMTEYFKSKGVKAASIHSNGNSDHHIERKEGVEKLEKGDIEVIFSVDMLNEGVDIPALDLIMFLRPTESPTVFLQQMGRGLRLYPGKKDVRILDFIGNFKKVDLIPILLGNYTYKKTDVMKNLQNGENLPLDCYVDFEFEVVDLYEKIIKSRLKVKDRIRILYKEFREEYSEGFPKRTDFFTWLTQDQYVFIKSKSKYNPFKSFVEYVVEEEPELNLKGFKNSEEEKFINMIENTSMSKMYKIPIIQSFLNDLKIVLSANKEDIIDSCIEFYSNNRNKLDMVRDKSTKKHEEFSRSQWWSLAKRNPIHFLTKTHGDIFEFDDEVMKIKYSFEWSSKDIEKRRWFYDQVKDALEFRRYEFLDQRLEK